MYVREQRIMHRLCSVVIFACLCAGSAQSQDYRAEPIYGYVDLQSGFSPDPYMLEVTAGGDVSAETLVLPGGCEGYIHPQAPHLSVNYEAGQFPLQIYVRAQTDTTLIINDPSGAWRCDDDSLGVDPALRFTSPMNGQYDVWVGTFEAGRARAEVYITER